MKNVVRFLILAAAATLLFGCSIIATYYRHDESRGNIHCSDDKALKRDSTCNATTK